MGTFISNGPEATFRFGEKLGMTAQSGWVIGLVGDLGAGKTQCVKGIAAGLGVTERVTSPTFALVNEYAGGRLPLAHIDLYRLETMKSIQGAGLDDYFETAGVTVVEWMDRWVGATPLRLFRLRFVVLEGDSRRIDHDDFVD